MGTYLDMTSMKHSKSIWIHHQKISSHDRRRNFVHLLVGELSQCRQWRWQLSSRTGICNALGHAKGEINDKKEEAFSLHILRHCRVSGEFIFPTSFVPHCKWIYVRSPHFFTVIRPTTEARRRAPFERCVGAIPTSQRALPPDSLANTTRSHPVVWTGVSHSLFVSFYERVWRTATAYIRRNSISIGPWRSAMPKEAPISFECSFTLEVW